MKGVFGTEIWGREKLTGTMSCDSADLLFMCVIERKIGRKMPTLDNIPCAFVVNWQNKDLCL